MNFDGTTEVKQIVENMTIDNQRIFRAFIASDYSEQAYFILGLMESIDRDGNNFECNLKRRIESIVCQLDVFSARCLKAYMEQFVTALNEVVKSRREL